MLFCCTHFVVVDVEVLVFLFVIFVVVVVVVFLFVVVWSIKKVSHELRVWWLRL